MKIKLLVVSVIALGLSGCAAWDQGLCAPNCRSSNHQSSSLVAFLYPDGKMPPREDVMPELRVPLRVGLAFLPAQNSVSTLGAAQREQLLEQIKKRFADRKFVADIVIIPDYYLADKRGFQGLEGVQRLYNVDVMALVSYDQVMHLDDNNWSLGYVTIVGAYVLKGNRHDVSTLVDLAVIDPATRSLILRAGGTDTRHGNTTLMEQSRETREASVAGFNGATAQMVERFDAALIKFESDVREGKAHVKVVKRHSGSGGGVGGGSFDALASLMLGVLLLWRWRGRRVATRVAVAPSR